MRVGVAVRRHVVLVTAGLVLSACATSEPGPASTPAPDGTQAPGTYGVEASAVSRPAADRLRLTVQDVADSCTKKPQAMVTVERGDGYDGVYVTLSQEVVRPGAGETCPRQGSHRLDLRLDEEGAKAAQVVVNSQAWGAVDQLGALQKCDPPFGCEDPPADRCDQAWIDLLLAGVEIAPERRVDTVACDGRWLVLDIDATISGCQGRDGQAPPAGCAGKGTHTRWFLRFDESPPKGWQTLASGRGAGCSVPDRAGLAVPRALCSDLRAKR